MTWFKVDDSFWSHPKCLATTPTALALWVRAGSWCAQQLTDGFVPATVLPMLQAKPKDAASLVKAGLWVTDEGGWRFHDWHAYQPTREQVNDRRKKTAERVRSWRDKRDGNGVTDGVTNAVSNPAPVPSRPVPLKTPLLTLVCRRLSGGTRETTTDHELATWRELVGAADLDTELRAWLMYNADVDLRNAGASLRGWLKKAGQDAARSAPGCTNCTDGWAGDDDQGRPIACPTCRPHAPALRVVGGQS
jgi:hypothetical protein